MKFWLISKEDIGIVREALQSGSHETNDHNCPDGYDGCSGCDGQTQRANAIHTLDTGLHISDAQPKG